MMNRLFSVSQCESTNDSIADFIPAGMPCITALYTLHQTKGRGQYGNSWQHEKDSNLAISFAVPAEGILLADSLFNYYTALLVRDLIANLTKSVLWIKWPNDLIIQEKKIAGILTEKRKFQGADYYITGIGINVGNSEISSIPNAGSVFSQTGVHLSPNEIAQKLYNYFESKILLNPDNATILADYNDKLFRRNKISCFEIEGRRQNGIIKSADADGRLTIELENDGVSRFYHKEIKLLY